MLLVSLDSTNENLPFIMKDERRLRAHTRLFRLGGFALLAGSLVFLVIDIVLAWIFVFRLTHPGCPTQISHIREFPAPEEVWLDNLRYWYYPSQNGSAILSLGGMAGSLGENTPRVDFLIREGFGILQVDSRACARPPAPVTLGADEARDAEAGLEFLLSRPGVRNVGVFGFSMGGAAAIQLAVRHEEIDTAVIEGSFFNLGDDFVEPEERYSPVRMAFLYSIAGAYWLQTGVNPWSVSPIDDLPAISPRPVFLIFGEGELASAHAYEQFAAANEPKALWIVPGGAHGGNFAASPGEYTRRVTDYFRRTLLQKTY